MGLKSILLGFCIFNALVTLSSCVSNNEEELYPDDTCDTLHVTYTGTIAPIINQHCLACHNAVGPSSGIPLEGYENLIVAVEDETLVGAINHAEGFDPMPENGPKLPACDIQQVEIWVNNGAPNN